MCLFNLKNNYLRRLYIRHGVESIRDLHGVIDRGNRGITALKTAVMGNGFSLSPR